MCGDIAIPSEDVAYNHVPEATMFFTAQSDESARKSDLKAPKASQRIEVNSWVETYSIMKDDAAPRGVL